MPKAALSQGVGHAKAKPPRRSVKKAKHEDSSSEEEDSEEESVESPEKHSSKLKNRGRLVASQAKVKRGVSKANAAKKMGGSAAPKKANSEHSVSDSSDDDDDDANEVSAKKSALHSAGGTGRLGGRSALMSKLALVSGAKKPTKVQESGSSSGSYSSSSGSYSSSSGSSSGSYSDSSSDSDDRRKPVAQALRSRVGMRGGAAMLNAAHKVSGFASHM